MIAAASPLPASKSSSTTWYSSSPLCLIACSKAVAMLVCLSIVFLCSWSCGSDATAVTSFRVSFPCDSPPPTASPISPRVALVISAMLFLYAPKACSTASATTGNWLSKLLRQNESCSGSKSYDFLPAAPAKRSAAASPPMSTRLSFIFKMSCTRGAYFQSCFTAAGMSNARSKRTRSGRSCVAPEASPANKPFFPFKWSLSVCSSARATASAAPPF
mmetsp:Transcript_139/g.424  ORF Transcript_139/g.424 Transcript_139/m.424 type:complete len:217 (+) Transcript_139:874-1524(+)